MIDATSSDDFLIGLFLHSFDENSDNTMEGMLISNSENNLSIN